jgi:GntR family transcriptional regulator
MSSDTYQECGERNPLVTAPFVPDATVYLYVQVADHLAERIAAGDLPVKTRLPAELRLCWEYGVSLGTIRHATEILRERGLVVTVRSKGTFVVGGRKVGTSGETTSDGPQTSRFASVSHPDE